MLGWIAIGALFALLLASLFGVYEGWTAHSGGVEIPAWGYAVLGMGIFLAMVVGSGLMALIFYSSRKGYDEPTVNQTKQDRDEIPS
jgi:hypothetical protein